MKKILSTGSFFTIVGLTAFGLLIPQAVFCQTEKPGAVNYTPPQTPCTKETAYQTVGKWGRQQKDDLAMADASFPKTQYKTVLAKAQKVIELFYLANPEFKGIQGAAKRGIRGDSYFPNGALPFSVDISYDTYLCVGMDSGFVERRGKIVLIDGYGDITARFNSFGHALASVADGLTVDGEQIFGFRKQLGEFKGFPMIEPLVRDEETHEAIIIAPGNRLPYKSVTREQFLQARVKFHQAQNNTETSASVASALGNMSSAERQSPAIVSDIFASPGYAKLFTTESEGGRHLVTVDKGFFNPKLPRETIQFITVQWNWDAKITAKTEAIRQFKQNFDFEALRQMLGK